MIKKAFVTFDSSSRHNSIIASVVRILENDKRDVLMNPMSEYNGYHATVTYDADDELFIGEVFGITDSLNFHGSSIEELKQMFANCINNYLS